MKVNGRRIIFGKRKPRKREGWLVRSLKLTPAAVLVLTSGINFLLPMVAEAAIGVDTSGSSGGSGTSLTVTLGKAPAAGDVLIAQVNAAANTTVTAPAGWTTLDNVQVAGGFLEYMRAMVFYKVAGSGEPSSYTFSWSSGACATASVIAYSGADTVNPFYTWTSGNSTSNSTSNTVTSAYQLSTGANNRVITVSMIKNSGTVTGTSPSMTQRSQRSCSGGLSASASEYVGDYASGSTPTTTNPSVTWSTGEMWYQALLVLNPARTYTQAAYRLYENSNNLQNSDQQNPDSRDDEMTGAAVDPAGGYRYGIGWYYAGSGDEGWMITKTNLLTGALVTSFNSGGTVPGEIQENINVGSGLNDVPKAIAIDPANDAMYIAGWDTVASGDTAWRIEKRTLSTGGLVGAFGSGGIVQENIVSGRYEAASGLTIDTSAGVMYVTGYDYNATTASDEWRIEKRSLASGAGVSGFGGSNNGYVTDDISANSDQAYSIVLNGSAGQLYVGGTDRTPGGTDNEQTIGDYDAATGALITSFGTDTKGHFQNNPTANDDEYQTVDYDSATGIIYASGFYGPSSSTCGWETAAITASTGRLDLAFNSTGTIENHYTSGCDDARYVGHDSSAIYVAGFDATNVDEWRIEKRDKATGALVSDFGNGGVATAQFYSGDWINSAAIDASGGFLYPVGASQPTATDLQWQGARVSLKTGSFDLNPLAAQDTAAVPYNSSQIRLRLLVQSGGNIPSATQAFKLQYAAKSGTCDTGFVGETYQDVGAAGSASAVRYYDNSALTNGTAISTGGIAMADGSATAVDGQAYEEAGGFSNSTYIFSGYDGLFDVSLESNADSGSAYCLRLVKNDGSLLDTYSVIPEVDVCSRPATSDELRGGTYFCNGQKTTSYFWSR